MEIQGKIIAKLPLVTGQGKNGEWRLQEYVLETTEQYPKKVCFGLFGDRIDKNPVDIDDFVTVSFDIESREWNGKWFTSIRAWKIEKANQEQTTPPTEVMAVSNAETFDAIADSTDDTGDLPF